MANTLQNLVLVVLALTFIFIVTRQIIIPTISPAPENLGVSNGRFAPCRKTPNCVSTHADKSDKEHYIQPLKYETSQKEAYAKIIKAVQSIGGKTKIIISENVYIRVENMSPSMGYIDDLEIYFDDEAGDIHFRSASRLGYSDMGMNRKRVEQIKNNFNT